MKTALIILLAGSGFICTAQKDGPKEFTEHVVKEFTLNSRVSASTLYIYNFSGFIKVEGTSGNKVIIEMDKTISAENNVDLETGKKEFRFEYGQTGDSIIAYLAEPFDTRPRRNNNTNHYDPPYEFNADFTVKVPSDMNLYVSTIMGGVIEVSNVGGKLHINNVNESISIKDAKALTFAHTVNGDINVTYVTNPVEESSYRTINGDIRISYRPELSADIKFKSMNGDLFTDFEDVELLPVTATRVKEKKGGNMIYKLDKTTTVRFGKGGKIFTFETLNGDVFIKKQS
jgi:DUF4097 and DUF4098 domain-containing protein YvlB